MYGPVPTAPPRGPGASAWRVVLRVVLSIVPVLSIGMLGWVSMLWLALVHRRTRDWLMLVLTGATAIGGLALIGPSDGEGGQTTAGMVLLLGTAVFVPAYLLAVELRPQQPVGAAAVPGPFAGAPLVRSAQPVQHAQPVQQVPLVQPVPPVRPSQPLPPGYPPPGRPRQDRIGEVRAGLDELSAYLQQQDRS
ncbi:hypothetical protein LN042_30535 [Kitasatospora sp. RB6PN24]|uniref:hypothetical protein n=1 Tax=Kitasatospora humi TaxID=2893891 RepID=UPI001E47CB1C|nr:hypothetical protein [Kitasatospora humi]MCC9311349.1 hypothetical protein [Kitasatospora humi]